MQPDCSNRVRRVVAATSLVAVAGLACSESGCTVNDSCPNAAPVPRIVSPADGLNVLPGTDVTFIGSAVDPNDGPVDSGSLLWTSDLDGPLGLGTGFSRDDLSNGVHRIVLSVTDDEGAVGADTAVVTVGGEETGSITIDGPAPQGSGAPHTVFEGTSVIFRGTAIDPQDGPLTGASLAWTSNVDGSLGTGTTLSIDTLGPGMHTVTLTATDSDGNETLATVLVIVKPAAMDGFQIHVRQSEGVTLSAAQVSAIDAAVARLQEVIVGDLPDLPTVEFPDIGTCAGASIPKLTESVDDVIIFLEFVPIDGPDKIIGSAGPCFSRAGTALALVGGMRFDTDDLETIEQIGLLEDILLHEMMHALGFGVFWESPNPAALPFDYLEQPSNPADPNYVPGMTDTHFTGPEARDAFEAIGGLAYTGGEIVPVENDTSEFTAGSLDGHWRESVFDEELMTPAANLPDNPLSVVTIAQFADLGYEVDPGAADSYTQTFSIVAGPQPPRARETGIDLSGDVWTGEIYAVYPDGTVRLHDRRRR